MYHHNTGKHFLLTRLEHSECVQCPRIQRLMARSYFNNIPFWDLTTQSDLIKAPNHGFIVYMGIRVHFLLDLGVWVLKAFCNQYFIVLHKANSY